MDLSRKPEKNLDARVVLSRDEAGKVTGLKFDFTDLEPVKVKDVKMSALRRGDHPDTVWLRLCQLLEGQSGEL